MSTGSTRDYEADLNLWLGRRTSLEYPALPEFSRLAAVLRSLQDQVAGARPPSDAVTEAADRLEAVARLLTGFQVDEPDQVSARLLEEPARGQTLIPPFHLDHWDDNEVIGRTRFSRFHLGSNGAAHGGAVSLFFDDLLGQLANAPGRPRARTASIRVDYRRITPIDHDVVASARVTSRDGRKITIVGDLRDGPTVLAAAEGLFLELRTGQQ